MIQVFEFIIRSLVNQPDSVYQNQVTADENFVKGEITTIAHHLSGIHLQVLMYTAIKIVGLYEAKQYRDEWEAQIQAKNQTH
jgi:hypothetical protein